MNSELENIFEDIKDPLAHPWPVYIEQSSVADTIKLLLRIKIYNFKESYKYLFDENMYGYWTLTAQFFSYRFPWQYYYNNSRNNKILEEEMRAIMIFIYF